MQTFPSLCSAAFAIALLTGSAALSSCARDESDTAPPVVAEDSHLVPVETALAALERFRPDETATRSEKRSIADIEIFTRKAGASGTRTAAPEAPLAYIVHFEGDGYAILGADDRQAPVVAYVPKGRLSAAELSAAKAAARTPGCGLDVQVRAAVVNYLEKAAANALPYATCFVSPETRSSDRQRIVGPPAPPIILLECDWEQGDPYNASCDLINRVRPKTGSAALALGQILLCNRRTFNICPHHITYRPPMSLDLVYVPQWTYLSQTITSQYLPNDGNVRNALAKFLSVLGKATSTRYGIEESTTEPADVASFLSTIPEYPSTRLSAPDYNTLKRMVLIKKKPVIVFSNSKEAWVIDGWQEETTTASNGQTTKTDWCHCRFGRARGSGNGWYIYMWDPSLMAQTLTYDLKGLVN